MLAEQADKLAKLPGHPSTLVSNLVKSHTIEPRFIPSERQVSNTRYNLKKDTKFESNESDSPSELRTLAESKIKQLESPDHTMWVFTEDIRVEGELQIVFTCDHFMKSFRDVIAKGIAHYKRQRCLKIIGDATQHQTKQKLKKLLFGVIGIHWDPLKKRWTTTVMPMAFCVCNEETKAVLPGTYKCIERWLFPEFKLMFKDYISDWYWHGKIKATNVFAEEFKNINDIEGHICLQHSKAQAGRRFANSWRHAIPNTLDWFAFLPTNVSHASADTLIQNLIAENVDTATLDYMTSGRGIGSFHARDGVWKSV